MVSASLCVLMAFCSSGERLVGSGLDFAIQPANLVLVSCASDGHTLLRPSSTAAIISGIGILLGTEAKYKPLANTPFSSPTEVSATGHSSICHWGIAGVSLLWTGLTRRQTFSFAALFALLCSLLLDSGPYLLQVFYTWGLQMELKLSPLEEQVILELLHIADILRYAGHQEASASSYCNLPPLLTVHQQLHLQTARHKSIALDLQVESQVLSV